MGDGIDISESGDSSECIVKYFWIQKLLVYNTNTREEFDKHDYKCKLYSWYESEWALVFIFTRSCIGIFLGYSSSFSIKIYGCSNQSQEHTRRWDDHNTKDSRTIKRRQDNHTNTHNSGRNKCSSNVGIAIFWIFY